MLQRIRQLFIYFCQVVNLVSFSLQPQFHLSVFESVLLQNVVEFLGLEFCEGVDALFQLANVGLVSMKAGLYLALVLY